MTIDLTEVKTIIVLIASLITSLGVICAFFKKLMDKAVDKIQQPILEKIEEQKKAIDYLDEAHSKDHILNCLNDIENGIQKNEFDMARLYEAYSHYKNDLHLNSYVHRRWKEVIGEDEI